jgi:acyl-CoA hydrolase
VSTTAIPDRFTTLPDEPALQTTVVALEEHGFSVEVVGDLDAARQAVLTRIPEGSSVMTNASVTLDQTGIADAINEGAGQWESARNKMFALDFATQAQQMKAIGGQPDYALGSVHAITRDGTLVIASASGSQLASYAWGAANVIFAVGAQKLVPTLAAAHERVYQHSLPLEDAYPLFVRLAARPGMSRRLRRLTSTGGRWPAGCCQSLPRTVVGSWW